MRKMAERIQARAIRRCGELMRMMPKAHGANQNIIDGDDNKVLTRWEAAKEAGLSHRQAATANRVASIPADQFTAMVESDNPPTVTKLAEMGTKAA